MRWWAKQVIHCKKNSEHLIELASFLGLSYRYKLLKLWWIGVGRSWPQGFVTNEGVKTYNVAGPS